ncbi:hypothetical protein [Fibrobacter sp. UWB11]|uniref:hypothetical protein n=1 Tax=Fibrobacter sp. UWB11 TaxID=1896202 RepID=UPI000929C6AC|nr:hypothetical protein [Fibrobacter sp. UWB11]SIN96403.1 hypothetical protein SAMN05720758_0781 [Fibrobacter sp. UWB11]
MEQQNIRPADFEKQMRKTGIKIAFIMALLMSLGLSLTGNLMAERPPEMPLMASVFGFLACFALSFVISFAIGLLVPMPKVNAALARKFKLQPRTPKAHIIESIASNLIYTPLITTAMVTFVYFALMPAGHKPPFLPMFIHSQVVCFIVAQVLIFIFVPIIIKFVMPKGATGMRKPMAPKE